MKFFIKEEFLKKLGNWIAKLRKARGLAQDKLGEEAGLSRGVVSRIENGQVDPQTTTLVKLAHVMDVPPSTMLKVAAHAKGEK